MVNQKGEESGGGGGADLIRFMSEKDIRHKGIVTRGESPHKGRGWTPLSLPLVMLPNGSTIPAPVLATHVK